MIQSRQQVNFYDMTYALRSNNYSKKKFILSRQVGLVPVSERSPTAGRRAQPGADGGGKAVKGSKAGAKKGQGVKGSKRGGNTDAKSQEQVENGAEELKEEGTPENKEREESPSNLDIAGEASEVGRLPTQHSTRSNSDLIGLCRSTTY